MLSVCALGFVTLGLLTPGCATQPTDDDARRQRIDELYAGYRSSFPDVPEVTASELAVLLEDDEVVLVDVREANERAVSTIPGALTREQFKARGETLRGRRVVTYCTIGYRSGLFAEELRGRGFDAWNLAGSILSWTHAGRPLVDDQGGLTHRVHVYGRKWDLAAEGYEAVW